MCAALTYVMASVRGGWDGGRGALKAGRREEKSDELMLLHCSSSTHSLHLVVFKLREHAQMHICSVSLMRDAD